MSFSERLDHLPLPKATAEERFRQALALYDEGVEMQRLALRRRHPEVSEEQIDQLMDAWLLREDEL